MQMNKIVLEHYPVSQLPRDIQAAVGDVDSVRLTVEEEPLKPLPHEEFMRQLRAARAKGGEGTTMEEAVARIRALRNEWDD